MMGIETKMAQQYRTKVQNQNINDKIRWGGIENECGVSATFRGWRADEERGGCDSIKCGK